MERYKRIGPFLLDDIWFDTTKFLNSKSRIVCLHTNEKLPEGLYHAASIGQTLLLDISKSIDEIYKGFEQKSCRYPIQRAQKDGVSVKMALDEQEYLKFLDFENKFCAERGIPFVSMEDIKELDIFYALSKEGEYLGGCTFLVSMEEGIVRYKHGATLHKLNANEAVLWEAICFYHEKGIRVFDFGGVISTEDKDSYYYRHYRFKKKFGGTLAKTYTYYRLHGFIKILYKIFVYMVEIFFEGNMNEAINCLHRRGMIK